MKCPVCKAEVTLEAAKKSDKYQELIDFIKQKDEEEYNASRKTTIV